MDFAQEYISCHIDEVSDLGEKLYYECENTDIDSSWFNAPERFTHQWRWYVKCEYLYIYQQWLSHREIMAC